jgi:LPS export ABC transporter protein LptC
MPSRTLNQKKLILLGMSFFGLITSCNHNPEEIRELARKEEKMSMEEGTDISITYADSGITKAVITTPLMERYNDKANPYLEMKKGLKAVFYNRQKVAESTLTAQYGISYENTKLVHLKNQVKVVNLQQEELSSDELFWDQNKHKIYTSKFVTIKRKNEIIYGDGFESNETFTKYRILNPKGRVHLKKD